MNRCQLWRFHPDGGGDRQSAPGSDRRMWTPCRQRVPAGRSGCEECYRRLVRCPNTEVRAQLAQDPRTPEFVLRWLTTDGDEAVAQPARLRLGEPLLPDEAPQPTPAPLPLPLPDGIDPEKDDTDE